MHEQVRSGTEVDLDVGAFLKSILRKLPYIFVIVALFSFGVYSYVSTIDPQYRSATQVLIEVRETGLTGPTGGTVAESSVLDQASVASQVELVRSRDLAQTVSERLDLAGRAEFRSSNRASWTGRLLGRLGLRDPVDERGAAQRVMKAYYDRLTVFAIEGSRVISIGFTSTDPQLASDAANTIAGEYLSRQSLAKRDTTAEAADWLSSQISELSTVVQDSEARIEAFRSENDLFSGGGQVATTLTQQQLTDLNTELTRVRALRASAQALASQIRAGLEGGNTPNQTGILNSPLIQRLVEQQIGLRSQIAQLSATLLPQHPRMLELHAQIADLDRQVSTEALKIIRSTEAEADLAQARENEIIAELNRLKVATSRANNAGVDLRALEREAAAQRDLLDSYLRRYREALAREQSGFLPADARVISTAAVPFTPSFPKKLPLTAAAAAAALMLAVGFLLLRDLASGRFMRPVGQAGAAPPQVPDALPVEGHSRWADDHGVRRMMPGTPTIAPEVMDRVQESLSTIVEQIRRGDESRVMVTLAEGSEESGRPLAAVALARALAKVDTRTVLVDLRGDGADAVSMGERQGLPGLSELLSGDASFAQAIFRDRESRAHFIPSGLPRPAHEKLSVDRLETVLSALSLTYDKVVLDASDETIAALADGTGVVVVVSEFNAADPRTVRAFDRISAVADAEILLLVVDPVPADEPPGDPVSKRPEAVA